MNFTISIKDAINQEEVIELYKKNNWSSAKQPELLFKAINNSHNFVTARHNNKLIGLGNSISDGYLVVYFPHLLIHPDFQGKGIGTIIMNKLLKQYTNFHMKILTADIDAVSFYKKIGFEKAGNTKSMWIYKGEEH